MTLASSQVGSLQGEKSPRENVTGRIKRIATDVKDGRSFYYFSLVEKPGLIFVATSNLSSYLPLSKQDDQVSIEYVVTDETEININEFINSSLGD